MTAAAPTGSADTSGADPRQPPLSIVAVERAGTLHLFLVAEASAIGEAMQLLAELGVTPEEH